METSRALSTKEENFVKYFCSDISPEKAAQEAGYEAAKESPKVKAADLLSRKKIQIAIKNRWDAQTLYGITRARTGLHRSINVLHDVVNNSQASLKLRIKSAKEILDRVGITNKNEISKQFNISVKRNFNNEEKEEFRDTVIEMRERENEHYESEQKGS